MAYRIIRPATHEEWLRAREEGIGSSEATSLMGVNHFEDLREEYSKKKVEVKGESLVAENWLEEDYEELLEIKEKTATRQCEVPKPSLDLERLAAEPGDPVFRMNYPRRKPTRRAEARTSSSSMSARPTVSVSECLRRL